MRFALSALGLYGCLSYVVEERNHEIAIRIAVGATARDVVRVVARTAGRVVTVGTIVGVAISWHSVDWSRRSCST